MQKALTDGSVQEYIDKRYATLTQLITIHSSQPWVINAMRCNNIRQGIYNRNITIDEICKLTEVQVGAILHEFKDTELKLKVNEYIEENNSMNRLMLD